MKSFYKGIWVYLRISVIVTKGVVVWAEWGCDFMTSYSLFWKITLLHMEPTLNGKNSLLEEKTLFFNLIALRMA